MYNEKRNRLVHYSKLALGIAERHVKIEEEQKALIAATIIGVLDNAKLNLTFEQRQLGRKIAAESMRLIESFDEDDPIDEVEGIVKQLPYRPPRFGETRKPGPEEAS